MFKYAALSLLTRTSLQPIVHPWNDVDAYSVVDGQTDISGVTLANYGVSPCPAENGIRDAAISGHALNAHAADGWHPVTLQSMELVGVDADSMVRLQPPNPDWLNQADCIDMDCDGPKVQLHASCLCNHPIHKT